MSLFVCSASGCAEWKTENMEEEEEDREEVFTVELHRGPHGLGLALVDGTVRRHRKANSYLDCLKSAFMFSHSLIWIQKNLPHI